MVIRRQEAAPLHAGATAPAKGDQYVFLAMAASPKAISAFQVGKRNEENTQAFVRDLRERIINAPEISTDGLAGL